MEAQFWNHEEQNPQWSINHPPYMYFDVLIVMTYSNWCSATELGVRPRAWCDLWCFPIGYSCKIPAVYWKCITLNNKLVLSLWNTFCSLVISLRCFVFSHSLLLGPIPAQKTAEPHKSKLSKGYQSFALLISLLQSTALRIVKGHNNIQYGQIWGAMSY